MNYMLVTNGCQTQETNILNEYPNGLEANHLTIIQNMTKALSLGQPRTNPVIVKGLKIPELLNYNKH